jgi:hypothetical protein
MLYQSLASKKLKIFHQCGGNMRLTRKQIQQLSEICDHFSDIDIFELEQSNLSGIGPTIQVKFSIFGNRQDASVDITDVESW